MDGKHLLRRLDDGKTTLLNYAMFAVLVLFTLYTLFPLYWMTITAFKPSSEIYTIPPKFFPGKVMFENMTKALSLVPFGLYLKNSTIVMVFAVAITVFINMLAGFAFAKYQFKGKNFFFLLVLSTLMIPQQITMVPNFIILSKLGWLNSYVGLIIPQCAEAFGLFLSRQFISELPEELLEAARMDGAGDFHIFRSVVVPNCKALMGVLVIFTSMWRWNDFLWPLVVITDTAYYTVQLGLANLQGLHYINWNDLMCASLVSILPVVAVFLVFQRFFVQGIAATGIKG